jgi:ABC-type Fe2+-enterobactin transport system substrate-binding protein
MSRFWSITALAMSLTACAQDNIHPGHPDASGSPDAATPLDGAVPDAPPDSRMDGGIELCSCDHPPAPTCIDSNTLRTYDAVGECIAEECNYASSDMPCLFGCVDGRCAEGRTFDAYLKASNTEENDSFGRSVSLSGDLLAVSAIAEDSAATGVGGDQANNDASRSGAVYIFRRSASGAWAQEAYLKASNNEEDDGFGRALSLSGELLAVGANGEDSAATGVNGEQANNDASGSGAVYIFRRSASGTWTQEAYLKASNTGADDNFGASVALSGDLLAVGAPYEGSAATGVNGEQANDSAIDSGAVYVFGRSASQTWTQEAYLKASNTDADDRFGASISLSGNLLAVGAYEEDSAATGVNGDQADNSATDSGAVYVFQRNESGTWAQEAYLKASHTGADNWLGWSVSLAQDFLAVGTMNEAVYVFHRSTDGDWMEEAHLEASNPDAYDYFGTSVALSGDLLAVGANEEDSSATGVNGEQTDHSASDSGAVYLFRRSASRTWIQEVYLKASNTNAGDNFGTSISVSGNLLAVGAPWESSSATGVGGNQDNNSASSSGAVYVYR